MKPLLSICIPTYNRSSSVESCVSRWLDFDVPWIEVVVVDNASTDSTKSVMEKIDDDRFCYYRNKENIGFVNIYYCTTFANGDFCMLASDEDLPVSINWEELRGILACKGINVLRGKSVKGVFEIKQSQIVGQNTYEAYVSSFSFAYMSGLIFRKSVIDSLPVDELKKYSVWRLYPQIAMGFLCMKTGAFYQGVDLEFLHKESEYHDSSAYNDTSINKPYYSLESRHEQHNDWIAIAHSIDDQMLRERIIYFIDAKEWGDVNIVCSDKNGIDDLVRKSRLRLSLFVIKKYNSMLSQTKRTINRPRGRWNYLIYRVNMIKALKNSIKMIWKG